MVRFLGRIACRFASAAAVLAISTAAAQAGPITIGLSTTTGASYYASPEGTLNQGTDTYSAGGIGTNATFECDWSVTFEHDPFYLANFNITNTSGLTQQFTLNVTLPVSPALPGPTVNGGYFGQVDFFDQNLDSNVQINTATGVSFFVAKIDGVGLPGIGTFTAGASGGPGVFGSVSQQAFGTPIPSQPGGAVLSTIGGTVVFELSPGDRASFPIYFQVDPVGVPEPAAALLIGLGVLGVAAIRRHRSE